MKQYIRKADIILLILLVALGLAASLAPALSRSNAADSVVLIKSGGNVVGTYSLYEDNELIIPAPGGATPVDAAEAPSYSAGSTEDANNEECTQYINYNRVVIKDAEVSVTEASCKNNVCVRHGAISKPGESIVCLPNRLIVSIESSKGDEYDSVSS